jgi:hypothetical protein
MKYLRFRLRTLMIAIALIGLLAISQFRFEWAPPYSDRYNVEYEFQWVVGDFTVIHSDWQAYRLQAWKHKPGTKAMPPVAVAPIPGLFDLHTSYYLCLFDQIVTIDVQDTKIRY